MRTAKAAESSVRPASELKAPLHATLFTRRMATSAQKLPCWIDDFFLRSFREGYEAREPVWREHFESVAGQIIAEIQARRHGWRSLLTTLLISNRFHHALHLKLNQGANSQSVKNALSWADPRILTSLSLERIPEYLDECERMAFANYLKDTPQRKRERLATEFYSDVRRRVLRAYLVNTLPTLVLWLGLVAAFTIAVLTWQKNSATSLIDALAAWAEFLKRMI